MGMALLQAKNAKDYRSHQKLEEARKEPPLEPSERVWSCGHLDFGPPAIRTGENKIVLVSATPPPSIVLCYRGPRERAMALLGAPMCVFYLGRFGFNRLTQAGWPPSQDPALPRPHASLLLPPPAVLAFCTKAPASPE